VVIGLPHDGQTFDEATLQDAIERMKMLREVGYRVPQYAIDAMEEEAAE
jgi:hypothetical protein